MSDKDTCQTCRWIPVSERLPEKTEEDLRPEVLVYDGESVTGALWRHYDFGWGFETDRGKPTHWKPIVLPDEPKCQTCKDTGEVDDTIRSVRAGIDINKPCPACQKPVCQTCGGSGFIPENQGHNNVVDIPCPDCQPKPEPSSEFVKRILTEPYNPKWLHTVIIRTEDRNELCARTVQLEAEKKRLKDLFECIQTWTKVYPLQIFPKPDLKKAHQVLKAAGMTLDAISADAMRHVLEGVKKITEQALKDNNEDKS